MNTLNYRINFYPFAQKIILIQLGIAIGIPFGILIVFLFMLNAWEALFLIGALLVLTSIVVIVLYGKMQLNYTIDESGIRCEPDAKQLRKNTRMNQLTFFAGLLSKNITASSSGLLAQSNQIQFFTWNEIKKIQYLPTQFICTNKFGQKLIVVAPKNQYETIKQILREKGKESQHV